MFYYKSVQADGQLAITNLRNAVAHSKKDLKQLYRVCKHLF